MTEEFTAEFTEALVRLAEAFVAFDELQEKNIDSEDNSQRILTQYSLNVVADAMEKVQKACVSHNVKVA
jgi:hypothetical protein